MSDITKIEWTHRPGTKGCTWNPIRARGIDGRRGWHCEHVSEACRNCYAERLNAKLGDTGGTGLCYKPTFINTGTVEVYLDEKTLMQPLHWRAPRTIFVCSMTDLFGRWVKDEWLDRVFAVAALCPQHTFILLTKRPERMQKFLTAKSLLDCVIRAAHEMDSEGGSWIAADHHIAKDAIFPLQNVWLGVTAEDQKAADERIPLLLSAPAAVRFVSCEPMLGAIDLTCISRRQELGHMRPLDGRFNRLNWVICGGETGQNARPMHPDWARALRDQCAAAGVPFFFKQWGAWACVYDRQRTDPDWLRCDLVANETPNGQWLNLAGGQGFHGELVVRMERGGKARAGRLLDGVEHNEWPGVVND